MGYPGEIIKGSKALHMLAKRSFIICFPLKSTPELCYPQETGRREGERRPLEQRALCRVRPARRGRCHRVLHSTEAAGGERRLALHNRAWAWLPPRKAQEPHELWCPAPRVKGSWVTWAALKPSLAVCHVWSDVSRLHQCLISCSKNGWTW